MAVFLITYDVDREVGYRDRRALIGRIKDYSNVQLSESYFAIKTGKHQLEVFNDLVRFLDDGDRVLVIPLSGVAVGQHTKETFDWLNKNLSALS